MNVREYTDLIVVHCAATKPDMDIGAAEIRVWHLERGFDDIGYHYVIRRDGTREAGRPLRYVGAHVSGSNHRSVGVCLVGGLDEDGTPDMNFTRRQMRTLEETLTDLEFRYPSAQIIGHRDVPGVTKACPCFDVASWWVTDQDRAP